ncbi:MAG: c-type cytochrome [Solirubrobacteraceae bacterium]
MLDRTMQRWHLLAAPILAIGMLWMTVAGGSDVPEQIDRAVRAPYEAALHRDATALCADFTPTVASGLVTDAPAGSTCQAAAAEAFAGTAPYEPSSPTTLPKDWTVTHIAWHRDRATALLVYGKEGSASFTLQKIAERWLIATRARLATIKGCRGKIAASHCPPDAQVLLLLLGSPIVSHGPALVPIPAAVKRVGGRQLSEFDKGRKVFAQSGCEACHQIGDQGNPGPGPALTHIGSTLSARQIEHAILDPTEPMPSFSHMPAAKLKTLVEFLSLLR